ncbi:MAG: FHA domain-containing serine/threonine-protein kinase [Acidobacteriota bacterium]
MSKLVFVEGPLKRKEVRITGDKVSVGRERGNHVLIPDASVSRKHAYIEKRQDGLYISDNKSTNGVYVNGNKVEECRLRPRDRIEFGAAACLYIESDTDAFDAAEMDRVRRALASRYDVLERLGEGSQASVYLGNHKMLGRQVALKVLRGGGDPGHDAVERFVKEARALARLAHPNIVEVFDVGEIEGHTYFALSYLKGGTLEDRCKKLGKLPVADAVKVGVQVGSGLAHAHGRGVIHRDVKPANVLFDDAGNAILADFGVAKILAETRLTATGAMFGTPLYMSPEQFSGKPSTHLSDLYSLAATIYKALTGRPPFEGETVYVVGHKMTSEDAKAPHIVDPSIPVPVSAVVLRALAKDPAARQQTVEAFVAELKAALVEAERLRRAGEPTLSLKVSEYRPRYSVQAKIATGRSSEIYQAVREGIGGFAKPVILKKILPAISSRAQFVAQFARSVEQAATLDHPGISKIFDFGEERGEYFVATEFLKGLSLREVLRRKPGGLPPPIALLASHELLGAVAYAHATAAVVHGDVRPENVLCTEEGTLKIIDFGLAVPTLGTEIVTEDALSGRLPYVPPERVHGEPPSLSADIYGVGAILFELCTGHTPYRGETRAEMLEKIVSQPPPDLHALVPAVPPEMAALVSKAIAKRPDDRWPSAAAMQAEVSRVLAALGSPPARELVDALRDVVRT